MRSCPLNLKRSLGQIKYRLHFLNHHWLDILIFGSCYIGRTVAGIRSKTSKIKYVYIRSKVMTCYSTVFKILPLRIRFLDYLLRYIGRYLQLP